MESHPTDPGLVIALDGPASSGKSSVGAAAAAELGYRFCDTGLLYRAVTWLALQREIDPEAPGGAEALVALVPEVQLVDVGDGRLARVAIDGVDETVEVHVPEVDVAVSAVSRVPELRAALLERQRAIAAGGRIVMAGRDIGTVVLPQADLKLFLDASVEERARRRRLERGVAAQSGEAFEILTELRRRDRMDSTRPVAPLRAAPDAIVIRTDGNAFETTVELVVGEIRTREAEVATRRAEEAAARAAAEAAAREAEEAAARAAAAAREAAGATTHEAAGSTPGSSPAAAPARTRRPPAKPTPIASRLNWFNWTSGLVLRTLTRIIVRMRVEGDPGAVPRTGPVIIAGNHASSADPVLIGAFLNKRLGRPVNWLGKRELVEMPLLGPFFRLIPVHPVSRDSADLEAFRAAMRILESGNILAIFPEGTRSLDGALQPVREGAGVLALRSGAPVMPVAIIDSDLMWPKGRRMPRFGRRVTVRWGKPFKVTDELPGLAAMPRREANHAATHLIMTRIAELLPPRQRGVFADAVAEARAAREPA
ncbi:MAG TPA: (d)CMP kinase [Candidatus Limnocylindrales bacterium]|nr:(d)CMP kinase [Candidatus Limnocylindrales bacterium]